MNDEVNEPNDTTETALSTVPSSPEELAVLQAPVRGDSAKSGGNRSGVPYVGFLGRKSEKHLDACKAAGIEVNEFFLMEPSVGPIRVKPFGIHLLTAVFRAFTLQEDDERGQSRMTQASLEYSKRDEDDGFAETLFATVAVVLPKPGDEPSSFVAATLNLRGPQARALRKSIDLFEGPAANPKQLAAFGPGYAVSAESKYIGGRFRANIVSIPTLPKGGGRAYNLGESQTFPTPKKDVAAFDAFVTESWPSIRAAIAATEARVKTVRNLAAQTV